MYEKAKANLACRAREAREARLGVAKRAGRVLRPRLRTPRGMSFLVFAQRSAGDIFLVSGRGRRCPATPPWGIASIVFCSLELLYRRHA